MFQDILEARTAAQFEKVIEDAAPVDLNERPQLVRSDAPLRSQERLIIRPGQSGGMLTRTEFQIAKFCTEEKLKKRTSDRLIGMIKTRAFVIEDIRADSIREIEKMISDSCRSKITEHDLWREIDGVQDVKVYLRSLPEIVNDLLLHLGYHDLQYLHFEYQEVYGEHMFGSAAPSWSSRCF